MVLPTIAKMRNHSFWSPLSSMLARESGVTRKARHRNKGVHHGTTLDPQGRCHRRGTGHPRPLRRSSCYGGSHCPQTAPLSPASSEYSGAGAGATRTTTNGSTQISTEPRNRRRSTTSHGCTARMGSGRRESWPTRSGYHDPGGTGRIVSVMAVGTQRLIVIAAQRNCSAANDRSSRALLSVGQGEWPHGETIATNRIQVVRATAWRTRS